MENQCVTKPPNLNDLWSPICRQNIVTTTKRRYSPIIYDPYTSDSSESSPSPLIKYLTAYANEPVVAAPVNINEDVIVMDGIPVSKNRGERNRAMRTLSSSVNIVEGGGSRVNYSENRNSRLCYQKNRALLYQSCDNRGTSKTGWQVQFVSGKEDLRRSRSSGKTKPPEISVIHGNPEGSNTSLYGTKSPPISGVKSSSSSENLTLLPTRMASPSPTNESKKPSQSATTTQPRSNWNPCDDNIDVTLPSGERNPPREDVDDFISKILYGNNKSPSKRLPVFREICPN